MALGPFVGDPSASRTRRRLIVLAVLAAGSVAWVVLDAGSGRVGGAGRAGAPVAGGAPRGKALADRHAVESPGASPEDGTPPSPETSGAEPGTTADAGAPLTQRQRRLQAEAQLEAEGGVARSTLIERQSARLKKALAAAEDSGHTERARLLRKRLEYHRRLPNREATP